MYYYCTLFDSNYLSRGLAMYDSLKKSSKNFYLYIFAFDDRCYKILTKLKLEHVKVVSLKEFEDEDLLKIKNTRTKQEYCWTATPSIIKYCIEKYNISHCTYIDADLYFFKDPSILIEEMGEKSILLTEHRYTPIYDRTKKSGIYCVQFMTFKNNEEGLKALNWWRDACLNWCYVRIENGKFGDQKYLDDWPERFKGVHVLKNIGGGVAPWNIQQYDITKNDFELVFYHFHSVKFLKNNKVDLGRFYLSKKNIDFLYKPYLKQLLEINNRLNEIEEYDYNGTIKKLTTKEYIINLIRMFLGIYNIYDLKKLLK